MNSFSLKESATELRKQLNLHKSTDNAAMALYVQLEFLISAAERGEILQPIEPRDIPGHRIMEDSNLRDHKQLSEAYSNFYVELNGGRESESFKMMQELIKELRS
jgi:hypothetical protein